MADSRDPLSRPAGAATDPGPLPKIDPEREEAELRRYLGGAYDHSRLIDWEGQLEREAERLGDEQLLYHESEAYLYNLTAFAMTRTKEPYLRDLAALVPAPARVLDYGCGIGSDGLALAGAGYAVEFADFANPSVRYLRWRLERRGVSARIHDLDREAPPAGFDAAFAFDVIEHVDDPFALLARLESLAALVVVNFLDPEPGETRLHHALPVADLLAHARDRGLRRYRRYHGRSHLVAYSAAPRSGARMRSVAWRHLGGRRARLTTAVERFEGIGARARALAGRGSR
ncbi:MAG: class I SAM-dependent methyltransferase [Solirubrobacteraceae bacterium]